MAVISRVPRWFNAQFGYGLKFIDGGRGLLRVASIVSFGIGLILMILALPRLMGAIILLPLEKPVASNISPNAKSRANLDTDISYRDSALQWIDDGRIWRDIGLSHIQQARLKGYKSAKGHEYIIKAKFVLMESAVRAPTNPFTWAQLAFVENILTKSSPAVEYALIRSLENGKYEPRLVFSRLGLALTIWHDLAAENKAKFIQQIDVAARLDRARLVRIITRTRSTKLVQSLADADGNPVLKLK